MLAGSEKKQYKERDNKIIMGYFTIKTSNLQFTKSKFPKIRKYLFKMVLILLLTALMCLAVSVATSNWYILTATQTSQTSNSTLKLSFGLHKLCIKNQTNSYKVITTCKNLISFHVDQHYKPLEETKNFNVLVVVFTSVGLVTAASTWFCKNGVPKKTASYISVGCILFSGICGAFGFREAYINFYSDVNNAVKDILNGDWKIGRVSTGYSYKLAISGEVLLLLAVCLYTLELKLPVNCQVSKNEPTDCRITGRLGTKSREDILITDEIT